MLVEQRKSRRKEEKEKQKARRKEKLRNSSDTSLLTRRGLKNNRMENSSCRIRICIDCRFDSMMSEKDVGSLQKQISFSYSANRRSSSPCQFYLTNVDGKLEKRLESNSALNWDIFLRRDPLEKVFQQDEILYLTSESENVLSSNEPLDEKTVYVIGGLVDHNSRKGLCHELAVKNNWRHARLPIDEFVKLNSRRVLACNHVLEILLNFIELSDWKKAFEKNIPKRKLENDQNDQNEETNSSWNQERKSIRSFCFFFRSILFRVRNGRGATSTSVKTFVFDESRFRSTTAEFRNESIIERRRFFHRNGKTDSSILSHQIDQRSAQKRIS